MNRKPTTLVTGTNCAVDEDHQYAVPKKLIKTQNEMYLWEKSEAYMEYLGFIHAINKAIEGKNNDIGSQNPSEEIMRIDVMLDDIDTILDDTPPIEQPQRFGNQAFREFYKKIEDNLFNLLQKALPQSLHRSIPEIMAYLVDSFGNPTRIDYGTGHEISFIMFLCCLFKIGFFTDQDKAATGCKIFTKYLVLCRKLQQTYRMEPAGSHGVWSLDDYQFVPFIWGSSQLIGHPTIEPPSFLKQEIVDKYADRYMFLACIKYINSVKTGPFSEHSNQLWNVSGVPTWVKVNGGLIRMYKAEVLNKFPVIQHVVFGTLFTINPANPNCAIPRMKNTMLPTAAEIDPLVMNPPLQKDLPVKEKSLSQTKIEEKDTGPPPPPPKFEVSAKVETPPTQKPKGASEPPKEAEGGGAKVHFSQL